MPWVPQASVYWEDDVVNMRFASYKLAGQHQKYLIFPFLVFSHFLCSLVVSKVVTVEKLNIQNELEVLP